MACSVEVMAEESLIAAHFRLSDLFLSGTGREKRIVLLLVDAATERVRVRNLSLFAEVGQALRKAVARAGELIPVKAKFTDISGRLSNWALKP